MERHPRPLVLPIPPGAAPGGLVFRLTRHDGTVLSLKTITAENQDLTEAIAEWQGTAAGENIRPGEPTTLNVFDGDTGQCVYAIVAHY